MADQVLERGLMEGDCDDAATFASSVMYAAQFPVRFVAMRRDKDFEHVLTEFWDGYSWKWIDPTVPPSTHFFFTEAMKVTI